MTKQKTKKNAEAPERITHLVRLMDTGETIGQLSLEDVAGQRLVRLVQFVPVDPFVPKPVEDEP